ncbi:MAG: mechanosensitive ion channel [Alphaproteobacteria bacterium]|nr:mechanosensitive ion channel [Alphaproteobacteria bacterium]MCZ6592861.1 mechanosensitive ion channel [Alphaproteobacteria bacterium]
MDNESIRMIGELTDVGAQYALDLLGAILLIIFGWILAGWVQRILRRALDRIDRLDSTLRPLIASVARYTILIFVIVAVLAQFGVQTTSIIAALGAIGLAVALALQGTLANIAAGVMLLLLRPFKVGDYIDAEGLAGTVDEVGLFTTRMHTFDGVFREVPNSQLWNRAILNYSRLPTRRIDVTVGVSYDDDIERAMSVLKDLLDGDTRVLHEPPAQVMVAELADSSVDINLRCWVNREDYWDLRFDITKGAKLRLGQEGITIPFPQRDVHLFPV